MQLELHRLLSNPLSDVCRILQANSTRLIEVTLPILVEKLDQNGVYVFGMYEGG
jgi:hypothetical protein